MSAPKLADCKRVLIVEGHSDLYLYAEVLEYLGRYEGVFIKQFGGKKKITKEALEDFLRPDRLREKEAIGVIVDANGDAAATAASLTASLLAATGQSVAASVWTPAVPRLGLFVAPGGGRAGEVESLVWEAWSNDAKHAGQRACIEGFLSCMEAESVQPKSVDKARVSALLAVLCDDDPRLGPGARAKLFDYARPEFGSLLAFLADL